MPKLCAHHHYTISALKRHFPTSLVAALPNSENKLIDLTQSRATHTQFHYTPFVTHTHTKPLYNTPIQHTSSLQLHPHTHHVVTLVFVDIFRRSDCSAGQMDGESGWWTTTGIIRTPPPPPIRKGEESGYTTTQEQECCLYHCYFGFDHC